MVTRRGKEGSSNNGDGKGKIKFRYMDSERVVDFSVENMTGVAVTDGLHSIANALAGRTLPRAGQNPKRTLAAAPAVEVEEGVETPAEESSEQEVLEAEQEEIEEQETPKPKRVQKPKAPKLLGTPKLTDAKVPLEDFMKQKNPDAMWDKYAVVAVWYKQEFQITEISIDHIFTAFKHLGWESQLPTDISTPLKNLTYKRQWFDAGGEKSTFAINWLGESEVGKMGAGAVKA
jgi:hypothetical protein